jgi:hypothetical protein
MQIKEINQELGREDLLDVLRVAKGLGAEA